MLTSNRTWTVSLKGKESFLCPKLNEIICLHGCIFIKFSSLFLENFTRVPQLMLLQSGGLLCKTGKYCANGNTLNHCPFSENSKFLSLPPTPPKMGSQNGAPSCKPHGGGRAEVPTPLQLKVGTAVLPKVLHSLRDEGTMSFH